jgi:hypothetical protein
MVLKLRQEFKKISNPKEDREKGEKKYWVIDNLINSEMVGTV